MKSEIYAYKIKTEDLPLATTKMNYREGSFFESSVINIMPNGSISTVIVNINGFYPFITNQWNEFIIKE